MKFRRIIALVITAVALGLTVAVGVAIAGPALANEVGSNGA